MYSLLGDALFSLEKVLSEIIHTLYKIAEMSNISKEKRLQTKSEERNEKHFLHKSGSEMYSLFLCMRGVRFFSKNIVAEKKSKLYLYTITGSFSLYNNGYHSFTFLLIRIHQKNS